MKRLFLSMLVALMALASWAVNNDQAIPQLYGRKGR